MGPRASSQLSQKESPSNAPTTSSTLPAPPRESSRCFPSCPILCISGVSASSIPCYNAESLSREPDFAPECLVLANAMLDSVRPKPVTPILSTRLSERAMNSPDHHVNLSEYHQQQYLVIANSMHVYVVNPFVDTALSAEARTPTHVLPAFSLVNGVVEAMEFVPGSSFEQPDPLLLACSQYEVGLYSLTNDLADATIWHEKGFPFGIVEHPKTIRILKGGTEGLMGGLSEDAGGGNSWFEPELIRFDLVKGGGTRKSKSVLMRYDGFRCCGYSEMDVDVAEDEKMMFVCGGRWGVKVWALDQPKCLKEIDKAKAAALLVVGRQLFTESTGRRRTIRAWDLRKLEEQPVNEFLIDATPNGVDCPIVQLCRSTGEDRFVAVSKDSLCLWNSSGKVYGSTTIEGSRKSWTGCCLFPHEEEDGENTQHAIELAERMEYLILRMTEEGRIACQIVLDDGLRLFVPQWMEL